MRQSIKSLQENLKFDSLMGFLDTQFQLLPDRRASNSKYRLASVVKSAFAMFSLKSPSLLDFKQQTSSEQNNLRSIYLIEGEIPCDNQMRVILDDLGPKEIRPIFASVFQLLNQAGVIKEYRYWDQKVIISIDGVEHFSSTKVHCPSCTSKTLRNGAHLLSA